MKTSKQNSILNEKHIESVSGGTKTEENGDLTIAKKSFLAKHHKAVIAGLSVVSAAALVFCICSCIAAGHYWRRYKGLVPSKLVPSEEPGHKDVINPHKSPIFITNPPGEEEIDEEEIDEEPLFGFDYSYTYT